ncbi:MAG: ATP-binding protein [Candidatus Binataceae bacterium]
MKVPSLRNRIRNGALIVLLVAVALGALALPAVYNLSGAVRRTLYRNYATIEAAHQMHRALYDVQAAGPQAATHSAIQAARESFDRWMTIEKGRLTEKGEPELASDIEERAKKLFADVDSTGSTAAQDKQFTLLHDRLDQLIQMNRDAMFRADRSATDEGRRLAWVFAAGLVLLMVFGAALSWSLGWRISRPFMEMAERLKSSGSRGSKIKLGEQPLTELQSVADEFNKLADRLEGFDQINVERLMYEKGKTEAIIESVEDGIILIDPDGVVTHINELGAIIIGVEREDALGSRFDDLNSNHPHYLKTRAALRRLGESYQKGDRVELSLHVRGRDHNYLLKPVPLRDDGKSFGTLLILQDITYLRDQDRARTNLVATLSHQLRTPLTALNLAAEMLRRERSSLDLRQQELVGVVTEEAERIGELADDILDLARSDTGSIAVSNSDLDLARLVESVVGNFRTQAKEKHVTLDTHVPQRSLEGHGDPIKLSWVVSNLVGNALRYTPDGGSIDVFAERSGSDLRLTVADSGPGIAPEVCDRIFERSSHSDHDEDKNGSAGLGLAIVKEIVEAHGGRIFVESSTSGSRFTVQLPIAEHA